MTHPDVSFGIDPDPRWAQVDYAVDPKAWADAAAEQLWTNTAQAASRDGRQRLALMLSSLVPPVDRRPLAISFFCPEPWIGPTAVLEFTLTSRAEGDLTAVLAQLTLPVEVLTEPAEQHALESKAGPLTRLRQRYREPGSENPWELAVWVWWVESLGVALVGSTTFLDPLEAERWMESIDGYLVGVELVSGEE
jgi:hypothetical protein